MQLQKSQIPSEILKIVEKLEESGFEAWIVGGCVRDLYLNRTPHDWDITTNATPEEIQRVFEHTYYTNDFGTVGVVTDSPEEALKVVEVTPYRLEGKYSDARRPDNVTFSQKLEDDLKRRDFTINALAFSPTKEEVVDLYEGVKDIKDSVVRAVGEPKERFSEDALRILRAIRIAAELDLSIEEGTREAMVALATQLERISKERVRDEFIRIINSPKPLKSLVLAQGMGVLKYVIPELEEGIGVEQNQAHSYDVFEHNLRSLQHAADKGWSFDVRLAALYHDIGKPKTRRRSEEKGDWTFYGHDVVGAKITRKALEELRFSREIVDKTERLVRWHMFFSDPDKITLSAVRRIVRNVGRENIEDLVKLRICDRIGTGRPKEQPFRLRMYQSMIEQALRDPISVGMLAIDGKKVMGVTREAPGPRIGWILHALLEEVLDDPSKNTAEILEKKVTELNELDDNHLRALGEEGREKKEEAEEEKIRDIRKKYFVS